VKKSLPKNEIIWEHRRVNDDVYLVTSNALRAKYNLWKQVDGGFEFLESAKTPALLITDEDEPKSKKRKGKRNGK